MNVMRRTALAVWTLVLAGGSALAQTPPPDQNAWSISASVYTFIVPDDRDVVQPTLAADRGWLHLAARYNYEDVETGSVWFGYNFGGGKTLGWTVTPMIGGVVGTTAGVAPGWTFSLSYWKLELASESEYVINARDTSESFFYNWSELSISPVDWFRAGAVVQRTRVYQSDRDVQRGLFVGVTYKIVDVVAYVFNPDDSKPIVVLAASVGF